VTAKVDAACQSWRFPSSLNHALATAGMSRAAGLLDQALVLAERPPSIGANVLVRAAFEAWIAGAWALFGGADAILGMEAERLKHERALAAENGLPENVIAHLADQEQVVAEATKRLLGSAAPSSVKYREMARLLPDRIREQTLEHEDADVLAIYDMLYRAHSTNDAHPWKPISQYVHESGLGLRVEPFGPWNRPLEAIATMAMYVGILGRWIDEARGHADPKWNELVKVIVELLNRSEG
jgi:hypothetical protein